jgi:ABC-type sugar transport system ATPase subunit
LQCSRKTAEVLHHPRFERCQQHCGRQSQAVCQEDRLYQSPENRERRQRLHQKDRNQNAFAGCFGADLSAQPQKVLVARWLLTEPEILFVDEPTRGIDVGAKAEIHALITKMAGEGKAVIMVSSEMPEILGMCDRILVMHEGRQTGIIDRCDATQERIMEYATSDVEHSDNHFDAI